MKKVASQIGRIIEFRAGGNPLLYSMSFNLRNGLKYGYVGTSNCNGGTVYFDRYRLDYSTTTNSFCQTLNTHSSGGQGGAWHHHAITKEGTVVKYYLDGVLAFTPATGMNQDNSLMLSTHGSFIFGSDAYTGGAVDPARCITGTLDELHIYQRALTPAEIVTVKNSTALSTPVAAAPILKFEFNNSLSNVGNTVTLTTTDSQTPTGVTYANDRNGNANSALSMQNKCYVANAFTLPTGKNQRTVSFWFNRGATLGHFWAWGQAANNRSYGFNVGATTANAGSAAGFNNYGYGTGNSLTIADTPTTNVWEHYVFTYDGRNVAIYKNGILYSSGEKTSWDTLGNILVFGGSPELNNSQHQFATFKIDDFEVYNTFFNSVEALSLYNSQNLSAQNFQTQNLKATIYPNPASTNFTIETATELKSVEIYSLQGQKVLTSNKNQVDVSGLSKGIYMVRVEDVDNGVSTQKMVKE